MTIERELIALREEAKKVRDPTCADETLALLLNLAREAKPSRFLEIGAGECLTSISLFLETGCEVTAIERDRGRCERARALCSRFGAENIRLIEGDAGEILPALEGPFGLIFLDGPKAQYRRYFSELKRLTARGGVLVSDDVLLFGWVRGEPPKKRRMLAEHLREYLSLLTSDPDFTTEILELGEGVAVSRKR